MDLSVTLSTATPPGGAYSWNDRFLGIVVSPRFIGPTLPWVAQDDS